MKEEVEIEVTVSGKARIVMSEPRTRTGLIAYVEVPAASSAVGRVGGRRVESPILPARTGRVLVFDHHGPLSHKRSACLQAFQWLRRGGTVKEPTGVVVTEPPLDADQVMTLVQLIDRGPAPEPVVKGVDLEDRKSAVALWHGIKQQGREELGAAVPVLEEINEVNEEYGGPWPEAFTEALEEAIRRVRKVIKDVKEGRVDIEREAERWVEEFEGWAEEQVKAGDVVDRGVVGGCEWVAVVGVPPTAMYVQGYDLVIAYGQGRVTVGISPISELRERLDLRGLFRWLNKKHKEGWGGRPDVGGSPKDYSIDREEFEGTVVPLIRRWLEERLG